VILPEDTPVHRKKRQGRSGLDWIKLTKSDVDLSGIGQKLLRVNATELAKHCTKDNAWIVVRGKVYNITPYLEYHPGGIDVLLRGAGKDATKLFELKHSWVNPERLLEKCMIGIFLPSYELQEHE